ncbi:hypothetical protein ID866_4222 [Astraeus odoratus]|nr:hypothetical protein ID866_4222 [Astraeus odoratus]
MATSAPEQQPLIVLPTARHTASVIFIHGLGDSGQGCRPVVDELSKDLPHVKWILPHAPCGQVTAHNKNSMPRWFDILSFTFENATEDRVGMLKAARAIDELIQKEVDAGIPSGRVVIGGFSQGATVALLTGLTSRPDDGSGGGKAGWKLGGIAIVSGWLPLQSGFQQLLSSQATTTPILWGHGTDDNVVRHKIAEASVKKLTSTFGIPMVENLTFGTDYNAHGISNLPTSSPLRGELGSPGLSFRTYKALGHSELQVIHREVGHSFISFIML